MQRKFIRGFFGLFFDFKSKNSQKRSAWKVQSDRRIKLLKDLISHECLRSLFFAWFFSLVFCCRAELSSFELFNELFIFEIPNIIVIDFET